MGIPLLMALLLFESCRLLDKPPDVIILTIDTLRVDHVSAFNHSSPAFTPHLDALAKDGIVYPQTITDQCYGTLFVSLMTGMPLTDHNVSMNVFRGGPSR